MLSIHNVTKRFGHRDVLKNASFEVEQGETVGLIGRNGCGKSTLLRIVARILSCDHGSIFWKDKSLLGKDSSVRGLLLYLGHEPGLYPTLSASENLQLMANLYGANPSWENIADYLDTVGLDYYRQGPIREFSRGMLQRLSLAKALIISWKLLLLDEPTTGLDRDGKKLLSKLIESWRGDDRSILIVSHDRRWISKHTDRIVILENGEIKSDKDIKFNPESSRQIGEA